MEIFQNWGVAVKCFKSFSGLFIYLLFFIWSLNLRGLARNELLPGHLSHSDFSTSLALADRAASQSAGAQVSPPPVTWRTLLSTFKIVCCVGKDWDRLILLKNYELSQGYFLCQPEGRRGESFSFLTGLGRYSSTKWRGRIFKVNTVKLISFSDPVTTSFPLPVSIHVSFVIFSICLTFSLSQLFPL